MGGGGFGGFGGGAGEFGGGYSEGGGLGLGSKGYSPKPIERTFKGYVENAVDEAGGKPTVQRGGQDLFRLRKSGHGFSGLNATPNNVYRNTPNGPKLGKGTDVEIGKYHIRELYKSQQGIGTSTLRTRGGR